MSLINTSILLAQCIGFRNIQCEDVERIELNAEEFCILLYRYTIHLSGELGLKKENIQNFILKSIKTIKNNTCYNIYSFSMIGILVKESYKKINGILGNIDWNLEKQYMQRQKSEKDNGEKVPIDVYKENNQEQQTGVWKQICIEAIKGKYSYVDCNNI